MNKFDQIVKEFSNPTTPGNEYRIKKIIKDMSDKEFEELKIQFEQAVANIKDHNQENHSILILNDLIEEYRDE